MKQKIPLIEIQLLTESELGIYHNLNAEPFGEALADQVIQKLKRKTGEEGGLHFSHRDYCGQGLYFMDNQFTLTIVYDGMATNEHIAEFNDESEFANWLSSQSDQSLALYGNVFNNQTITRIRMEWYLEEDFSPTWNAYCRYLDRKEK